MMAFRTLPERETSQLSKAGPGKEVRDIHDREPRVSRIDRLDRLVLKTFAAGGQ